MYIKSFSTHCYVCTAGPVKKCGLLKVLHEKYRPPTSRKQPSSETVLFKQSLQEVAEQNKDLLPHLGKAQVREREGGREE